MKPIIFVLQVMTRNDLSEFLDDKVRLYVQQCDNQHISINSIHCIVVFYFSEW